MTPVKAVFVSLEAAAKADVVLPRGAVIRIIDEKANEPEVDILVAENRDSDSGFAMMVVSGYKAGISNLYCPAEAKRDFGIAAKWLLANWTNWYSERVPDSIHVAEDGYRLR